MQMDESSFDDVQTAHVEAFNARTRELADIDFEHYDRKPFGPWNPYWHVHHLVSQRLSQNCQRLLVVGCGNGRDALVYARLGYEVYGFDISPRAVAIGIQAAKRYDLADKMFLSVQAAEQLNYESEFFDLAVGVNVLHHVDVERSLAELLRVLKPGTQAIFKEPLITPWRDKVRNSRLVTWLIPKGVKSKPKRLYYDLVPGEKNLDETEFALIRKNFTNLSIQRWHVLAKLAVIIGRRPLLERCDWMLFKFLPFVRRLGDQAVLTFEKAVEDGNK